MIKEKNFFGENEVLLSITIPTYNRGLYLKELLDSIKIDGLESLIEIIVIDNASSENENIDEIVSNYRNLNIKFIKNEKNIGPDNNFKKCIKTANGKFVWILGDDEILFPETIYRIIEILMKFKDYELGMIFLRSIKFEKKSDLLSMNNHTKLNYTIFDNPGEFLKEVNIMITFISSSIINRNLVVSYLDIDKLENNHLVQVYWNIITSVFGKKNLIIQTPLIAARIYNSGNYEICSVFIENLYNILLEIEKKFKINLNILKDSLAKRLLISYLPANIIRYRCNLISVNLNYKKCVIYFWKHLRKYIYLWIFPLIAIIIPKRIGLFFIKVIDNFRNP